MTTPRSQVFGTEARFNEDVTFLKNLSVGEEIIYTGPIKFNVSTTFLEDVFFKKSITVDGNVSVGGISTFSDLIDANDDVDVAKILTVRQRLNVGVSGTVLSADVNTENVGIGTTIPATKFQFNPEGDTVVSFDEEGRVGIGTTNVGNDVTDLDDSTQGKLKLDVQGSIAIDRNIYDSTGAHGENNFFLSRDEFGIRWVNIVPQDPVGIFLQDEGVFVPTVGVAQSFTTLNFVQKNSDGEGTDTIIPTAASTETATGLSTIFTQDLWGYNGAGDIYRLTNVGVQNDNPARVLDVGGTLRATGIVEFTNSTDSAGTNSGALVVSGGVGIGAKLNVGGNTKVFSNLDSSGSDSGALVVTGGVGIGAKLNVGGNTKLTGTLELDNSLIDVNGNIAGPSVGATDYRLSSVGTGVSWRPPGVQTKRTIWVTKNGNDLNSGLLEGDAKATLGGAAAVAQEGDTIKIRPGKYIENNPVGLRTDVSVTGEDLRLVTLVPQNKNDDVIHVRRGCLVENLSFAGGVVGSGVEIGCDRAGAVAFPPTQTDIDAGISVRARSGFTGLGPADEGTSGRWRSPYVRNCTNFMTGSIGMKINGDHATASDPDSGADLKSMVCDSFTQYNEAGIGVSLSNDAYAQLVSIFTINCDIAIYAETGGQCDLTNSNSSFGNFGLVAVGLGATQYTGFASNTNSAGEIITENASEIDTIVAYGVTDKDGDDQRPFDGQALYFKINNVGQQNYPTVPAFDRLEEPMKELSAINIIPGATVTGFSALNPPSVTILDGDTVNNPGGGPLGPQGIVAEGSATVDGTGTITEFNVIASGRNYLPTQNLIVDVDGNTGIATAVTEPIFYTVFEATPNTGYYNKLTESDPGIVGITTITLNEFIPYAVFPDDPFTLQRISRILTSSHSFEYVGTGTDINRSTPLVGGVTIKANEVVASGGAQIPFTSTDQKGNFDVGEGLQIDQTTSTIRGRDFSRAIQVEVTPLILALR